VATGQTIMVWRSPHEAVRLQIAYVQATLASGLEHAGDGDEAAARMARPGALARQRGTAASGPLAGAQEKRALTRIGAAAPPVWAFHAGPKSTIIPALELSGVMRSLA
jgi:hypothetical protein